MVAHKEFWEWVCRATAEGDTGAVFDVAAWAVGKDVPWQEIKTNNTAMALIRKVFDLVPAGDARAAELERLAEGYARKKK